MSASEADLRRRIAYFIAGEDRSLANAQAVEVLLDELFGDEEPYYSLMMMLASYRPGDGAPGEFLYGESQVVEQMNVISRLLRQE